LDRNTVLRVVDTTGTLIVTLILILGVAAFITLLIAYVVGIYRRAANLLSEWATRNGYRIVESERRNILKGPFFWTSSNNQIIYRVTVQDSYGNVRRGWVRCGSYLWGAWQSQVDVRWDE
jgi:hypothetical protein